MVVVARNSKAPSEIVPQQLVGAAVALSLGLLLAAIITSYVMFLRADQSQAQVEHTLKVQRSANELWSDMLQAESAQRGYLITSDASFVAPYQAAKDGFAAEFAILRELTADNLNQQRRLDELQGLAKERFELLNQNTDRVRNGQIAGAVGDIKAGRGKTLMDQMRPIVTDFKAEEDRLLNARDAVASRSRNLAGGVIIVAILLSIIAAGLAIYLLRTRLISLAKNRDLLEARVIERTAELEASKHMAETEAARATREQERVELLLRDLNHRVGNNLATISSLLGLQINRLPAGQARGAIESARNRIGAIGIAQRRLRLGEDLQTTRIDEFFNAVLSDMFEAIPGTERLKLNCEFQPLIVGSRDAITLSVVMNELITNALKHAFPAGRAGAIDVSLSLDVESVPIMTVADDGVGIPAETTTESAGLGATVVDRMSQQYGGAVVRKANQPTGTIVTISMPRLRTQPATDDQATGR